MSTLSTYTKTYIHIHIHTHTNAHTHTDTHALTKAGFWTHKKISAHEHGLV